jgi:hypothetical protein
MGKHALNRLIDDPLRFVPELAPLAQKIALRAVIARAGTLAYHCRHDTGHPTGAIAGGQLELSGSVMAFEWSELALRRHCWIRPKDRLQA